MNLPKWVRRAYDRDRRHPEYAGRDPQWTPPDDPEIDSNGLSKDQRRIWREFMAD